MKRRDSIGQKIIYAIAAVAIVAMLCLAPRMWDSICGNEPVRFYGRVVDPSGKAIGGVTIDIEIVHYTSPHLLFSGGERVSVERVTSDRNGEFELTSGSGTSLTIRGFKKDSQQLESAFPPRDIRRPISSFVYSDAASKAQIPDTPARRLDYPVHGKRWWR
jgi:hypothetical protein